MVNRPQKKSKSGEKEVSELEVRKKAFIQEMEELEKKHQMQVQVKLVFAEAGIVPRIVLIDQKENAKTNGETEAKD